MSKVMEQIGAQLLEGMSKPKSEERLVEQLNDLMIMRSKVKEVLDLNPNNPFECRWKTEASNETITLHLNKETSLEWQKEKVRSAKKFFKLIEKDIASVKKLLGMTK